MRILRQAAKKGLQEQHLQRVLDVVSVESPEFACSSSSGPNRRAPLLPLPLPQPPAQQLQEQLVQQGLGVVVGKRTYVLGWWLTWVVW